MNSVSKIQLIPDLISLETNAREINCFSFWDKEENKDFFKYSSSSRFAFKYLVGNNFTDSPKETILRFSNFSYDGQKWYFKRKLGTFNFSFSIDERNNTIISNTLYHRLFIKVSWIEPIGYILTDYVNYQLEKEGLAYFDGAAARINGKSFIFLGFGKNYKTTLVNMILQNGGFYIGEEFFLLEKDKVYATIPNSHRFDFRESHRKLMQTKLNKRKIDVSEYEAVVFLVYSNIDKIVELNFEEANSYAEVFHQYIANSFFYGFLKARDLLQQKKGEKLKLLNNPKAKFFLVYFTDVKNAFAFVSNYGRK